MKLKASASANFLFPGADIAQVLSQASEAGFDALEFQFLQPSDAERIAQGLEMTSLPVALINFDVGDFIHGGAGLSGVPGRADDFKGALGRALHNAQLLGPSIAHIGPCRVPAGANRERCILQLVDNLHRALDEFSPLATRLSMEALNRSEFPDVLIGSPEEAMEVIESVDDSRLVLQYDIYHAARDGRDILQDLKTYMKKIGHVQFADCPGRHEPGTGLVDFEACFGALRCLQYSGFVGAEYKPSRDFNQTLWWMPLLGS